ncbi:uncharacterized protein LY89DRAFT_666343 [Mollisia scopiformis]|uniref:Uncharacterized protein n=1 Tax=Mollisia scopiformis TaxID=149040 RepID=A0A194XLQ3_MOLSC|nr:uncharacterized protein LY89DRAFT_666343 [Mollisia scopiformis]KUJ20697.1 hypothetical protein LY89DRAFT_666343 [Mollisia scopiformis]
MAPSDRKMNVINMTTANHEKWTDILEAVDTGKPVTFAMSEPYKVTGAQSNSYWSGRFMALDSKIRNEAFDQKIVDYNSEKLDRAIAKGDEEIDEGEVEALNQRWHKSRLNKVVDGYTKTVEMRMTDEEFDRTVKVFKQLGKECGDKAAETSLSDWQELYARTKDTRELLPVGGFMTDGERRAWETKTRMELRAQREWNQARHLAETAENEEATAAKAAQKKGPLARVSDFFKKSG